MKLQDIGQVVEINCPELFRDPAFEEWLNRSVTRKLGLATWHTGARPGDMSDVFITYDHGVASDVHPDNPDIGMPKHCWDALHAFCEANGVKGYAILRLLNFE